MNIVEAISFGTTRLRNQSASARLDAEVILAFVLDCTRTQLATHPEAMVAPRHFQRFRQLIARRRQHLPIPYLTGRCDFFGLQLRVTPAVLVPRPFTELLIEAVLNNLSTNSAKTIVDVGTGSGAIALALASRLPRTNIVGTDVSLTALRVARHNARALKLGSHITWRHGSLLQPLPSQFHPEVVIANLPYLTKNQLRAPSIRHEPKIALDGGALGLALINKLLTQVNKFDSITIIALEFDPPQFPTIRKLLKQWSPNVKIIPVSDGRKIRGLIAHKHTPRTRPPT